MRGTKKTTMHQCPLDHLILLVLVCSILVIIAMNWVRVDKGGAIRLLVLVWEISINKG